MPVNSPGRIDSRTYQITFETQTMVGAYQLTLGPGVTDFAANPMPLVYSHILQLLPSQTVPLVNAPPASRVVGLGKEVVLSVGATSESELSFQWRLNGQPIPGATGAIYTILNADGASAGRYTVVVSNRVGSVESAPANVSLFEMATFAGTIITGPLGGTYRIEYRHELDPADAWQTATTVTLAVSPTVWIDQDSPEDAHRFYRAVLVP